MLSIIIPYRNRDMTRLKNCLESLEKQTVRDFKVYFVDYGSGESFASQAQAICSEYDFVSHNYCNTKLQPWNKSRALNSVIKILDTDFCFVADVDMIFHPDFINITQALRQENATHYFQVGFLSERETTENKAFSVYSNYVKSTDEATGLSLFPVAHLREVRGFDEFYHLWGAEDTDIHVRLKNAGYPVIYYDQKVLLLHQWHESYRSLEKKRRMIDFQLEGIARINNRHLELAKNQKKTQVNKRGWGNCPSREVMERMRQMKQDEVITNERGAVDHFLFNELPMLQGCYKLRIDLLKGNVLKNQIKTLLNKDIMKSYSLKEISNKFLLHLINFYRDTPYILKIDESYNYIEFAIDKSHCNVSEA